MGRVLVTGASGHLGANLVRQLLTGPDDVRVLVRQGSDNAAVDGLDVERHVGDIRHPDAVRPAVHGCRRVYHCAARISTVRGGERELYECNVLGTRNVLDAARAAEVQRVVVTGSLGATGMLPGQASDERVPFDPFAPHTAYEHTKALVEHEALRAAADGLDVVVAASCAIVGPHDYKPSRMGSVLLRFAARALRGYVPGGFEFVTVRDIVAGHVLAMDKGRSGQKYLFGSGYLSMDDLMALFEAITGMPRPRLRLPPALVTGIGALTSPALALLAPDREQLLTPAAVRLLALRRRADCVKAQTELGFRPTSIADAVRAAYDDFARRGLVQARRRAAA